MVKKLFKHEFFAYMRIMSVVYLILFTVAAAGRIILLFENDSIPYRIVITVTLLTYGVSVFATFGFIFALAVIRFYKNLFTSEGYLSFTLPVTPAQHIGVKAVTAVSMELITFAAVMLSGCIITSGELLVEIWNALAYMFKSIYEELGFQVVLMGAELAVLLLLSFLSGILLYYTFISIGQLFKKNRILAAVGAYFVYYILTQIISTVFSISFSIFAETDAFYNFLSRIGNFATVHPFILIHSIFGIYGLVLTVLVLAEFIVVKKIITNKLNLE